MRIIIPFEEILVEHSTYLGLASLKRRLLRAGLLTYHCYICGIKDWLGEKLSLELDHINGIPDDNRLENLRLLCPNCHSQTPTYKSKRLKKHWFCPCGKEIQKYSKHCNRCEAKLRHRPGNFRKTTHTLLR